MPARLGADSAAGPGAAHQAATAAAVSGPGRKARASRSATAAASPPASQSSTKPPAKDPDTSCYTGGPNPQVVSGPDRQQQHAVGPPSPPVDKSPTAHAE